MGFAVLRVRVVVNLFYQLLVERLIAMVQRQRAARSGGELSLVMYLNSGGQTWGITPHGLPMQTNRYKRWTSATQMRQVHTNAAVRQGTRPSTLAALGTVRGFRP